MTAPASQPTPARENAFFRLIAPSKPSRKRLVALWIVLGLWIITLVTVYFLTVAPRHPSPPERGLTGAPAAEPRPADAR